MTTFTTGPAKGATLNLVRLPFMLRVVVDRNTGKVDALNELADEPRDSEDMYIYRMVDGPHWMHVCCADRKKSGFRNSAKYELIFPQPDDIGKLRDYEAWANWCDENAERLGWKEPKKL